MSALSSALEDYLALRRSLGFKLERAGKLLAQFVTYCEVMGADVVTIELALSWATLPEGASPNWLGHRLSVVRGFARHLALLDDRTEVPPADMLPARSHRATPYLYTKGEVVRLMGTSGSFRSPLRRATVQTVIGLLYVTGMRIGSMSPGCASVRPSDSTARTSISPVVSSSCATRSSGRPANSPCMTPQPLPFAPTRGSATSSARRRARQPSRLLSGDSAALRQRPYRLPRARARGGSDTALADVSSPAARPEAQLRRIDAHRVVSGRLRTSSPVCHPSRRIWATSTRRTRTGICRPRPSCSASPPSGSSPHRRSGHEHARTDTPGVLH